MYSPLVQYGAGTTAKDVGIVGIGGLVRPSPFPCSSSSLTSTRAGSLWSTLRQGSWSERHRHLALGEQARRR